MRKADLIDQVSEKTGISQVDTLVTIEQTLSAIRDALAAGESVFMRGFSTLSPKKRAAKTGRNIMKGGAVHIPAHYVPHFKPALEFKHAVGRLIDKGKQLPVFLIGILFVTNPHTRYESSGHVGYSVSFVSLPGPTKPFCWPLLSSVKF